LFQIYWSGLPNTIRPPCGEFFQLNTGKARSQGIEVETAILLSDNLLLNLNGSYINAELTEDVPVLSATKGDPLPGSADVNFSAGLQYDSEIKGYPAYLGTDVNYVGDFYNNLQETGTETGDYWVGNIRAGVTFNRFTFEIFAKNFTDSSALTWLEVPIVSSDQRGSRLRPRTIGISFRYDL
jgi:outer membrane receptor protein involved in Fe transport